MRAVQVTSLNGPTALEPADLPVPQPNADEVLVEVHAAGAAFPDLLVSYGRYQITPPLPFVPGTQLAGVVTSAPAGTGLHAGDRVCAFTLFGSFAETVAVPSERVFRLPDRLPFTAGAAVPTNYFTADFVLVERARLVAGETVLVHGAAGGVGLATVQLASALGAQVIAVVSTPAKGEAARASGAAEVIDAADFRREVDELTDGRGADIVVDPVGGDRFTDSLRSLGAGGRLVVVGFTAGEIPTVRVNRLLLNNTGVLGAAWGEYASTHAGYAHEQWARLEPLFAAGSLRPHVARTLPLDSAAEALRIIERREAIGSVVLQVR